MHETSSDIAWLQDLLDRSFASATGHLTSIMEPHRRLSAMRLVEDLHGILVLNVATVTTHGEPRISAVDGHFLHGKWHFGTSAAAVKTRHLRARPAVSAAYTPRDGYGVFAHGTARELKQGTSEFAALDARLRDAYGHGAEGWPEPVSFFQIEPHWMVGFAMSDEEMSAAAAGPQDEQAQEA
jgi:hypothetical protein